MEIYHKWVRVNEEWVCMYCGVRSGHKGVSPPSPREKAVKMTHEELVKKLCSICGDELFIHDLLRRKRRVRYTPLLGALFILSCRLQSSCFSFIELLNHASRILHYDKRGIKAVYSRLRFEVPKFQTDVRACLLYRIKPLKLDDLTKNLALEVLDKVIESGYSTGKSPFTISAACVYIACLINKKGVTQEDLAKVFGVSEMSIRSLYHQIVKKFKISGAV